MHAAANGRVYGGVTCPALVGRQERTYVVADGLDERDYRRCGLHASHCLITKLLIARAVRGEDGCLPVDQLVPPAQMNPPADVGRARVMARVR